MFPFCVFPFTPPSRPICFPLPPNLLLSLPTPPSLAPYLFPLFVSSPLLFFFPHSVCWFPIIFSHHVFRFPPLLCFLSVHVCVSHCAFTTVHVCFSLSFPLSCFVSPFVSPVFALFPFFSFLHFSFVSTRVWVLPGTHPCGGRSGTAALACVVACGVVVDCGERVCWSLIVVSHFCPPVHLLDQIRYTAGMGDLLDSISTNQIVRNHFPSPQSTVSRCFCCCWNHSHLSTSSRTTRPSSVRLHRVIRTPSVLPITVCDATRVISVLNCLENPLATHRHRTHRVV